MCKKNIVIEQVSRTCEVAGELWIKAGRREAVNTLSNQNASHTPWLQDEIMDPAEANKSYFNSGNAAENFDEHPLHAEMAKRCAESELAFPVD